MGCKLSTLISLAWNLDTELLDSSIPARVTDWYMDCAVPSMLSGGSANDREMDRSRRERRKESGRAKGNN